MLHHTCDHDHLNAFIYFFFKSVQLILIASFDEICPTHCLASSLGKKLHLLPIFVDSAALRERELLEVALNLTKDDGPISHLVGISWI